MSVTPASRNQTILTLSSRDNQTTTTNLNDVHPLDLARATSFGKWIALEVLLLNTAPLLLETPYNFFSYTKNLSIVTPSQNSVKSQNVGSVLDGASKDHEKMFYGDEDSTAAMKYQTAESFEMEILYPVGVAKRDANLIHMAFS